MGEGIISNNADQQIGEGLAPANALSEGDDLARADFTGSGCVAHANLSANSANEDDNEADFQLASSLPLPAPVTQVVAVPRGPSDSQPQPTSQSEDGDQRQNFDDFHDQFLNNHISTIEEDFEGENMTSEFSTQRTNAKDPRGGSDRGRAGNRPGGSGSASGSAS